ncbi:MAG: amidase [Acidobacteria bacterium]|nr:amidase [Acidobacteriota bacterium]
MTDTWRFYYPVIRRRCFVVVLALLLLALRTARAEPEPSAVTFRLESATIADINAGFNAGVLTSERLVRMYLDRIAAYDKKGPTINAIITLKADALDTARALDAERMAKGPRSPLHGIPVVVKDLFDTYDMPTTGGFAPMAKSQPHRDAFVIKRLRDAGAIILAKTNLNDWFGERPTPGGSSTLGGQTINPYDLERIPGASSSGTGAAMAAYFATVGLGTDTGGSVLAPAADSNIAGMIPTAGLVSRGGVIANSFTQERVGPLGRSVYDIAVVLSIIAGFDADDLLTMQGLGHIPSEPYTVFLDKRGLQGARIGILRDMFSKGPEHKEGLVLTAKAIQQIRDAGAIVVDPVSTGLDLFAALQDAGVYPFEGHTYKNHYLTRLGPDAPIHSLEEMVEKAGNIVSSAIRTWVERGPLDLDHHKPYHAALKNQEMMRNALTGLMDRLQLDALVFPFKTLIAPKVGDARPFGSGNRLSSYTGLPSVVVPAGFTSEGLPIAIQILGKPFSEPALLRLAYAYEQISQHRKTPSTTPPLPGEESIY